MKRRAEDTEPAFDAEDLANRTLECMEEGCAGNGRAHVDGGACGVVDLDKLKATCQALLDHERVRTGLGFGANVTGRGARAGIRMLGNLYSAFTGWLLGNNRSLGQRSVAESELGKIPSVHQNTPSPTPGAHHTLAQPHIQPPPHTAHSPAAHRRLAHPHTHLRTRPTPPLPSRYSVGVL